MDTGTGSCCPCKAGLSLPSARRWCHSQAGRDKYTSHAQGLVHQKHPRRGLQGRGVFGSGRCSAAQSVIYHAMALCSILPLSVQP